MTFAGWNVLFLIFSGKGKLSVLERIALSYGLGIGFVSLEMLLFYFFKARFTLAGIISPWLVLVADRSHRQTACHGQPRSYSRNEFVRVLHGSDESKGGRDAGALPESRAQVRAQDRSRLLPSHETTSR